VAEAALSGGPVSPPRPKIVNHLVDIDLERIHEKKNGPPAIHSGEFLREDILPEVGLSVSAAAKALGVSRQMLHDIVAERKPPSAVMCLKMSRLFGSSPEMWMRLQSAYDLKKVTGDKNVMRRVALIVPIQPPQPK
jgi:antitoxin HigA-1